MAEMTAVAWHGRGDVRVETWPLPERPPDGWVRIRVAWCGICGSDTIEYTRGPVVIPTRPHPLSGRQAPLVLGHEISGTLAAVGRGVTGIGDGDRVVTDVLMGCDSCTHCRSGQVNLCRMMAAAGLSADGGLADYVDVPAASCVLVPAGLPLDVAALAEPLSVAVRAVRQAGALDGADIIVLGGGAIGLLVAMLLRDEPVRSAVVTEPVTARGDLVRQLTGVQVMSSVRDVPLADDAPAQVVFECTGSHAALNELIAVAPPRTRVVLAGVHGHRAPTDLHTFLHRELEMVGSLSHSRSDFRAAVDALAADPERYRALITHRIGREQVPAALRSLAGSDATTGKILAGPEGEQWTAS